MHPVSLNLPFIAQPVSLYGVLVVLFILMTFVFGLYSAASRLKKGANMAVYGVLSTVLGLFFGRLLYCAVRFDFMFYNAIGEYAGLAPFFDVFQGNLNVGGILIGLLLAAPLTALITREKTAALLDSAVLPVLLLYAGMRAIEPLSGHGYGDLMENSLLCFYPLSMMNEWGDWILAVCYIEAILAALVLVVLFFARKKMHREGSLYLWAMALFCPTQMFAELFRHDDVLYIFIFASVTLLCIVTALVLSQFALLIRARKEGLGKGRAVGEALLMLLGVILCIGGVFALDKTNIPDLYVYIVMALALIFITILFCQRIAKEDKSIA